MTDQQQTEKPIFWRIKTTALFIVRGGCDLRTAWYLANQYQADDDRTPSEAVSDEMSHWEAA